MPKINVLPKEVAELIAAGEVVERPASVIKEVIENAVDAHSTKITVVIKNGGITYMQVTDNGSGIENSDVPTAFLRHATSKIKKEEDLYSIMTLGFRGEALAAISSVSKVEMLTKQRDSLSGTKYVIEGGEEKCFEETGCADGTTVIIRDLFYNTPARMKFLKKDVTEGNAILAVVERMALSNPDIAFKFIRDGKTVLNTPGDKKLMSAVYSVLGRDFATSLIEVKGEENRIKVEGYICKPVNCKATRNGQYFFLNGRLVKSVTAMAALEQAYKNSAMVGKFPSCVLNIFVPANSVDVNVHPSKTEVRFSNEKTVFDAVYYAVKNSLSNLDTRPQITPKKPIGFSHFERVTAGEYLQEVLKDAKTEPIAEPPVKAGYKPEFTPESINNAGLHTLSQPTFSFESENKNYTVNKDTGEVSESAENNNLKTTAEKQKNTELQIKENKENELQDSEAEKEIKFIGEAFSTYIIIEYGDSIFMIDKHAAHERINFENLKKNEIPQSQELLIPVTVKLSVSGYDAVTDNIDLIEKSGFGIEDFGNGSVIVRAVPPMLSSEDIPNLINEIADMLSLTGTVESKRQERIFETVACKSAIKAGNVNGKEELLKLAERVMWDNNIRYCPHGRPVAFEIKKKDLEKQFGRIQ